MEDMKKTTASRTTGACALAFAAVLAAAVCAPPALAVTAGAGDYPVEVTVDAEKEGENVVSVVVPSSVSIVVRTSVVDGRVMGVSAETARVENSRRSYAPISVDVDAVTDTPVKGGKLLGFMDMRLLGDHEAPIAEGGDLGIPLFDGIAPGSGSDLEVRLVQRDENVPVPVGSYAVRALLRVEPVEESAR